MKRPWEKSVSKRKPKPATSDPVARKQKRVAAAMAAAETVEANAPVKDLARVAEGFYNQRVGSKYAPIYAEQVKILCEAGATLYEIADFFGVNHNTLYLWKKMYPEFGVNWHLGKQAADDRVEASLYAKAVGFSHPEEKIFQYEGVIVRAATIKQYAPDTEAAKFWLTNRKGDQWKTKAAEQNDLPEEFTFILDDPGSERNTDNDR